MGGKPPVNASEDERRALADLSGSRDRAEADWPWAIVLTLSGWTSGRIAEAVGVREDTARLWRSDFMRDGIAELNICGTDPLRSQRPCPMQPFSDAPAYKDADRRSARCP
jgi:hypothetical protein